VELDDDAYRVIANALTEGQGEFSEEDFEIARLEIVDWMVKGQLAALTLEGKLSISVEDGVLKYQTSTRGKADLDSELAELGISLEQFKEELRRGR
jgi:hypothetical protein